MRGAAVVAAAVAAESAKVRRVRRGRILRPKVDAPGLFLVKACALQNVRVSARKQRKLIEGAARIPVRETVRSA